MQLSNGFKMKCNKYYYCVILSPITSQISFAVRATMMNIHTFINTAWNQTASQPTSVKYNTKKS